MTIAILFLRQEKAASRNRRLRGTWHLLIRYDRRLWSRHGTAWSGSYRVAVSTLRDAALWLAKTAHERFCRSTISPAWSLVRT
jgi:hypothetical protein